jgi:hypothetical protein
MPAPSHRTQPPVVDVEQECPVLGPGLRGEVLVGLADDVGVDGPEMFFERDLAVHDSPLVRCASELLLMLKAMHAGAQRPIGQRDRDHKRTLRAAAAALPFC